MSSDEVCYTYEKMEEISLSIAEKTKHRPTILIICGSGLSTLGDVLENREIVSYSEIADFPQSTVQGHEGRFVFGNFAGRTVVCMQGRFHPYEGYPLWKCAMPVRLLKVIGVKYMIVTNAAGGVNSSYKTGDIMIIKDQINLPGLAGRNPLFGHNDERWGPRFPVMNNAYCPKLRKVAHKIALELGAEEFIREGVYCMVGGPNFETVAEIRMLRTIGADAGGMSTCHEVITAAHCGIKTIGLSLITNECVADYETTDNFANHQEVLETGKQRRQILQEIIKRLISSLD